MDWNKIQQNHFYVIDSQDMGTDFFYVAEKTEKSAIFYELYFDPSYEKTKVCLPFPVEITTEHWKRSQWSSLKGYEIPVNHFFNLLFKNSI